MSAYLLHLTAHGANASVYALQPEFLDLPECALAFTHFREPSIENNDYRTRYVSYDYRRGKRFVNTVRFSKLAKRVGANLIRYRANFLLKFYILFVRKRVATSGRMRATSAVQSLAINEAVNPYSEVKWKKKQPESSSTCMYSVHAMPSIYM